MKISHTAIAAFAPAGISAASVFSRPASCRLLGTLFVICCAARSVAATPDGAASLTTLEDVAAQEAAILARPLFDPARHGPATPAQGGAPGSDDMPRLTGIIVSGAGRLAIFAQPGADGPARPAIVARVGDAVGRFHVDAITARRVVLAGPGGRRTVEPQPQPLSGAPAPPISVPPFAVAVPRAADPAQYCAPAGPLGIAMYRHSPAAVPGRC